MGMARYKLMQTEAGPLQGWLIALAVLCATYAYDTLGLANLTGISALWYGLIGNIVVIVFAVVVVLKLYPISKTAFFLTMPVIIWTAFASLVVIGEMKMEKLI
jgi:tryptophan-rich sensory protein